MKNKFNIQKPSKSSVFMVVFSLLCSLLFWVYVTSTIQDDYTATFSGVKVAFVGENTMRESRGLILTERGVTSVKVSITGDRRTISKLDSADLTAEIDLSTISSTGRYTNSSYKITYPSGIDSSTLNVSAKIPESITFQVDRLSSKTIPVKGIFNGSVAEGFIAEPLDFSPNSVKIYGPQNVLDTVDHAWIEVPRENVDKRLTYESSYVLRDKENNVLSNDSLELYQDTVEVTLPVISVKDVALGVKIINGGGATDKDVIVTIDPATIQLTGASEVLDGVNNINLATIDLGDIISGRFTETYPIVIPNDTEITTGQKEASVTVEIVGLETRMVSVTNISCTSVTEGYVAEIMSPSLDVTLRGPRSVLNNISDINVRAVADLGDYGNTTGFFSVPVRIYIDGTTKAGALGDYRVFINLQLDTETEEGS